MQGQARHSIVMDEIMMDPSPTVGLPAVEWVELKNVSSSLVDLRDWRIADASGRSSPFPSYPLKPDSFLIVCGNAAFQVLNVFGPTLAINSFPSLDNEGELLSLLSATGQVMHAVAYSSAWFRNDLKREGGWSLEMIDPQKPCMGKENWEASNDIRGGTPGSRNSRDGPQSDASPPEVFFAYTMDSLNLILEMNEPVDSMIASSPDRYSLSDGISIVAATPVAPLFDRVKLELTPALQSGKIYSLTIKDLSDCGGNRMTVESSLRTGIPSDPLEGEWIINEILFNPRPGGNDYIECLNNSSKLIDASRLSMANRNAAGGLSAIRQLSSSKRYVFPGEYLLLTADGNSLAREYFVRSPAALLEVTSMPSLPDDEGRLVLLNMQGEPLDELHYFDDWHFALLNDREGVSLERIDPKGPTNQAGNWHSASSTAGYGTPGYQNSQFLRMESAVGTIDVFPKSFSPDNDGLDDILTIQYNMQEPGFVASITIFNDQGRMVRQLVRNDLLGLTGSWAWDGLDDQHRQLNRGFYILFAEYFNLQGKKSSYKTSIALLR